MGQGQKCVFAIHLNSLFHTQLLKQIFTVFFDVNFSGFVIVDRKLNVKMLGQFLVDVVFDLQKLVWLDFLIKLLKLIFIFEVDKDIKGVDKIVKVDHFKGKSIFPFLGFLNDTHQ